MEDPDSASDGSDIEVEVPPEGEFVVGGRVDYPIDRAQGPDFHAMFSLPVFMLSHIGKEEGNA